jgi:hypothetical protein
MLKNLKILMLVLLSAQLLMLAGCGGGGTSSNTGGDQNIIKLTLSTGDTPNGVLIGGIQGTITLPTGSNVRVDPSNGDVLAGQFSLIGNAAASLSTTSFVAPAFTFGIINASGFSSGDLATLSVDVSSGSPTAASFFLGNLKVIDVNGATLNISVSIK